MPNIVHYLFFNLFSSLLTFDLLVLSFLALGLLKHMPCPFPLSRTIFKFTLHNLLGSAPDILGGMVNSRAAAFFTAILKLSAIPGDFSRRTFFTHIIFSKVK